MPKSSIKSKLFCLSVLLVIISISNIQYSYAQSIGTSGDGDGEFNIPQGIATNNTHIYISDTGNNRIQILNVNGEFVKQFEGNASGEFMSPRGITTNDTHIFVADTIIISYKSLITMVNS